MQAAEKKRPREERDILHRLRPFSRLQTAADYEAFSADILCKFSKHVPPSLLTMAIPDEAILRKKILDLQTYRRLGLSTPADIEKYEADLVKRVRNHSLVICSFLIYFK